MGKAAINETDYQLFLPLVLKPEEVDPIMLGIYPRSYWQPTLDEALSQEFSTVDNWGGKKLSLAGVFHTFNQYTTVTYMLETIWDQGYTPFVNIYSSKSIQSIATGGIDSEIRSWARNFASFANNGQRMAYLAPLQEMNGNWVPYGSSDPTYFKSAYQRIVTIFEEEGVPANSVRWTFAPNGMSLTGWPGFEEYYPGDSIVDVVGFSSYNYGFHPNIFPKKWETPEQLFPNYVNRMRAMAPSKPVFIIQTGTTAYGPIGYDASLKNQWLADAYNLVANLNGVRGILYYNDLNNYDWAFYRNDINFSGYKNGVSSNAYQYIPPEDLVNIDLAP
jgi:beta-mannanase